MKKVFKPAPPKLTKQDEEDVKSPWKSAVRQIGLAKLVSVLVVTVAGSLAVVAVLVKGTDFIENRYGVAGAVAVIAAVNALQMLFPPSIVLEDGQVAVNGRKIGRDEVLAVKPLADAKGVELTLKTGGAAARVVTDAYAEADQNEIRDALLGWPAS